jgi:hypothetical protein
MIHLEVGNADIQGEFCGQTWTKCGIKAAEYLQRDFETKHRGSHLDRDLSDIIIIKYGNDRFTRSFGRF